MQLTESAHKDGSATSRMFSHLLTLCPADRNMIYDIFNRSLTYKKTDSTVLISALKRLSGKDVVDRDLACKIIQLYYEYDLPLDKYSLSSITSILLQDPRSYNTNVFHNQ